MSLQPSPIPEPLVPPLSPLPLSEQSPATLHQLSIYLTALLSDSSTTESDPRAWARPPFRSPLGFTGSDFVQGDGRYALRCFHTPSAAAAYPLVVVAAFSRGCEGVVGTVHGGCVAVVFDEVVGYAMQAGERMGMTAELTVRYRQRVECPSVVLVECRQTRTHGRKVWVEARMRRLGGGEGGAGEGDGVLCTCEALLIDVTAKTDPFTPYKALKAKL